MLEPALEQDVGGLYRDVLRVMLVTCNELNTRAVSILFHRKHDTARTTED